MKAIRVGLILAAFAGVADAEVQFSGLYHNNTNLNAQAEAVPNLPTNQFLELQYDRSNVVFHFLTASPAGGAGESVSTSVRIFSTHTEEPGAFFQANITLEATNQFHGATTNGSFALDLWRVDWTPPHGFSGSVFYAPHVITKTNGVQTDQQYLIKSIGGNVGAQWGDNASFYTNLPQSIGDSPFGLDYSFNWTNAAALNYDYMYFNNTNTALPQNEDVPGLGGVKFFDYHYASNEQSFVHVVVPQGSINSMNVRAFLTDGVGLQNYGGAFLTNVVITPTNQFHGSPTSGAVTLDVWRAGFTPPSTWAGTMFYAPQVVTPLDGSPYLVRTDGTYTNNWLTNPQLFNNDPVSRDFSFTPTGAIVRTSINRDFAYYNNTNLNPQTELIPTASGLRFLEVNYGKTTTTFYVMTESPINLTPGDGVSVDLRTSYSTNGGVNYIDQITPMVFDRNIQVTAGLFHGLTTSGVHQVDLWRAEWAQPLAGGLPNTNAIIVYYAPRIITKTGDFTNETTWLLAKLNAGGPGTGTNNYPIQPQVFGTSPFDQDYFYINQYTLLDSDSDGIPDAWEQQFFGTTTNNAASDNDNDKVDNLSEYIAGTVPTNGASFFRISSEGFTSGEIFYSFDVVTGRVYTLEKRPSLSSLDWASYSTVTPVVVGTTTTFDAPTNRLNYRVKVKLVP